MKGPQSATKRLVNSKVGAATPICGALRRHLHQGRRTPPLECVHYDRIASGLGTASVSGHFGHHGLLYDGQSIDVDVVIITPPVQALGARVTTIVLSNQLSYLPCYRRGPPQVLEVVIKIREQVALTRCVSRALVCSRRSCHPPVISRLNHAGSIAASCNLQVLNTCASYRKGDSA